MIPMQVQNEHVVQGRDFVEGPASGGMLSPTSNATMDSERRSLMSPSQRAVQRKRTEPDERPRSHDSLHSWTSRTDSDGGISTTPSETGKLAIRPQPSFAVSEFKEFIHACHDLERYLESFTHHVQKLGSAFSLVKASRELHDNLSKVREYFEESAQTLGLLLTKIKAAKSARQAKKRKKRRGTEYGHSHGGSSISENSTDNFIGALNNLARSVKKFTSSIIDFEDYNDEEGNKALQEFEIELRVLSGGLEFFSADGESHELRRFVTARASSLKGHLNNLAKALQRFEDIGIPCISFAQKRSSRMLLNAATVATFFAGVAATTLQYSVELTSKKREVALNTLWFMSLVLSIGAAITGMLAMTWRLAVFSSPKRELPWYIRFWIRSGYMALLIASVVAFLAGLVIYVFDTMPAIAFWIVLACTVFCILGLSAVSVLFIKERYSFSQLRNEIRKELNPGYWQRIYENVDESWWYWLRYHFFECLRERRRILVKEYSFDAGQPDLNKKPLSLMFKSTLRAIFCPPWSMRRSRRHDTQDSEAALGSTIESKRPQPWKKSSKKPASAARRGVHARKHSDPMQNQLSPHSVWEETFYTLSYNTHLKQLDIILSSPVDTRAVHLQFSPDGHWLVVCYKYECCVFDVERSFDYHASLRHLGKNAKQVEWSANGARLITRTTDYVKVWTLDAQYNFTGGKTIRFDGVEEITDIQWLNDNEFLAIADDLTFYRVNVSVPVPVKMRYDPEPETLLLEIYYLYTLPDSEFVFIVGARNIEGLQEDKAIDCLIVYEMKASDGDAQSHVTQETSRTWKDYNDGNGVIRRRIPLLHEMESLAFGLTADPETNQRRMELTLFNSLRKPPEIWSVGVADERIHLSLERELVKKMEPGEKQDGDAEWGEAFLIGPSQSIVACAEDGMMYFWDMDQNGKQPSEEHFHQLKIIANDEEVEELPLVSWIGPRAEIVLPMMATAGKGLSLKIYAPLRNATLNDEGQELNNNDPAQLVAQPLDSSMVQAEQPVIPPYPTIMLPGTETGVPSDQLKNWNSPSKLSIKDEDDISVNGERMVPGSSYCTSPASSVKDENAAVQQRTPEE